MINRELPPTNTRYLKDSKYRQQLNKKGTTKRSIEYRLAAIALQRELESYDI